MWGHQRDDVQYLQAMPVPNTKPGFIFYPFFCFPVIIFYLSAIAPIISVQPEKLGTILYGVELFLISISHNNYSMLENMSRLSTRACNNMFTGHTTVTLRYLTKKPLFYFWHRGCTRFVVLI